MVHSQDCVVLGIVAQAEEAVRGVWTEGEYAFFVCLLHGWEDDLLLFFSQQSSVAAVRVQTQYRNLRGVDSEVPLEGEFHDAELAEYLFGADAACHVLQRNVPGHHSHLEGFADHYHRYLVHSELFLQIFGVTGVAEAFVDHRPLVYRCGHEHVYVARLYVGYCAAQGCHRGFRGFAGRLSRLYEHIVRQTVDYVDPLAVYVFGGVDHVGVDLLDVVYLLLVESEDLG